jgi:hypothetical protein
LDGHLIHFRIIGEILILLHLLFDRRSFGWYDHLIHLAGLLVK